MTMVSVPPFNPYPTVQLTGNGTALSFNSQNEGMVWLFEAPITGTLTHIIIATRTVTTGATIALRLETWDTASSPTWTPTGTLFDANGTGSLVVTAGTDSNKILEIPINGGAGISVALGDKMAALVRMPAGSSDMQFIYIVPNGPIYSHQAGGVGSGYDQAGAGTFGFDAGTPMMAVRYSTTGIVPLLGYAGPSTAHNTSGGYTSSSNPDEYGNRFVLPYKARIAGAYANFYWDSAFTGILRLRDASGTLLASSNTFNGKNNQQQANIRLTSPYTIAKNTEFSLSVENTSATTIYTYYSDYGSNAAMANDLSGLDTYQVTFNDGGSRTTTDTRRIGISPLIDQVDDGDGAGSGGSMVSFPRGVA